MMLGVLLILLSHRYLESVVSVLYFSWLKLFLWLLYLALKFVSVLPMYTAVLPSCVTVAWYTIVSVQQLPGIGHVVLF